MLNWLKERQTRRRTAKELYGSIVTQARQPALFTTIGLPDTRQGRFEALALHTALVMRRLQDLGPDGAQLARQVGETFVTDMDDAMREMSFSDLAVPREVKRTAIALYDCHTLLGRDDTTLPEGLAAQLAYLGPPDTLGLDVAALAGYLSRAKAVLGAQSAAMLRDGRIAWAAVAPAEGGQP